LCVITKSAILVSAQFNTLPHYLFVVQNRITRFSTIHFRQWVSSFLTAHQHNYAIQCHSRWMLWNWKRY